MWRHESHYVDKALDESTTRAWLCCFVVPIAIAIQEMYIRKASIVKSHGNCTQHPQVTLRRNMKTGAQVISNNALLSWCALRKYLLARNQYAWTVGWKYYVMRPNTIFINRMQDIFATMKYWLCLVRIHLLVYQSLQRFHLADPKDEKLVP